MATIYWTCKACKRSNQRRGVEPGKAGKYLICPGCGREHYVAIQWQERRELYPAAVTARQVF